MKYYIYKNVPNAPKISTENVPFIYQGQHIQPLELEGETLGIAINNYLDSQNSKVVSLSNLNLSVPTEEDDENYRNYELGDLILSKYDEVLLNNNNMKNIAIENKRIKALDLSGSNMENVSFQKSQIENLLMDNTKQMHTDFTKVKVDNFRAYSTTCNAAICSESEWNINKNIKGNAKYDFTFIDDVMKGSFFDLAKWDKSKIGHDKALNAFRSPFVHGNIQKGKYVLKSMKNFAVKPLVGVSFIEAGNNIFNSSIAQNLPHGNKINEISDLVLGTAEIPLKVAGGASNFLLHHTIAFDNPLLNTASLLATSVGMIGCMVVGQIVSDKLEEPIKKIGKFLIGKGSRFGTDLSSKVYSNFNKLKNIFSKGMTKVLYGSDRVTSNKILKRMSQENHMKIGYGGQEYIITDDKGAANAIHQIIDEKHLSPLLISCVAKVKNAPDNIVLSPEGDKIFSWIDKKNNELVTSIKYDSNGNVLEKFGDFSNISDTSYGAVFNKFLDNLDLFQVNSDNLKNIVYNKDTHRLVVHGDYSRVLRKSDNALDNDMDFAVVHHDKKTDKITFYEFQDRKKGESFTINNGEPKPEFINNTLEDTDRLRRA